MTTIKLKNVISLLGVFLAIGFGLVSCSKSDNEEESRMQVIVDGTTINFNSALTTVHKEQDGKVTVVIQGHILTGVSTYYTRRLDIGIIGRDDKILGTHTISPKDTNFYGTYYIMSKNGKSHVSSYIAGPYSPGTKGKLVVDSYNGKKIKGTFEFYAVNDKGQHITMSKGVFKTKVVKKIHDK